MKNIVLFIAVVLFTVACIRPEESGVKVIVGAKLGSLEYSVVVIADGKFRAVGPQSSTPVPKGAKITSGLGMTIEPLAGGPPVEPGQPADLVLRGVTNKTMRNGEWAP